MVPGMPTLRRIIFIGAASIGVMQMVQAAEVAVDRGDQWFEPSASHHGLHFAGGMALGVVSYGTATLLDATRVYRYGTAAAVGLVVGAGYEVVRGLDGSSYIDGVDVAWTVAGSLAGAAVADLTGRVVGVAVGHRSAAVTVAFRF